MRALIGAGALAAALGMALAAVRPAMAAAEPLAAFRAALAAGGSVHVVQLGDSHTAGDYFSGRLRALFQGRHGAPGHGLLPPGLPFPRFRPDGLSLTQGAGWRLRHVLMRGEPGPFGPGGFRGEGQGPEGWIEAEAEAPFDRLALSAPCGSSLALTLDGRTAGTLAPCGFSVLALPAPARRLRLAATAGPAVVTAFGLWRSGPGVVWHALGLIGATVSAVEAMDLAPVAALEPALVVLAYGTNEGFQGVEPAAYEGQLRAALARLRQAAPAASLLVLGPPDGSRAGMAPPGLAVVRAAQRAVAGRQGLGFWDWQAAMGGPGAILRWAAADPPLALKDGVHLRAAGYALSAERLFEWLAPP
ncbi:MAG: SGNH/GDSL hydrolase family protein [Thalassobaculales bacterium]